MDHHRAVFGFELDTPFPLRTARVAGSGDRIVVEMDEVNEEASGPPLLDWVPGPRNPIDATLSRSADGYLLDITGAGRYLIDSEARHIVMPVMPDEPLREVRLLGLPLLLCFLARGDMSLHGAAVMGPDGAIILAAPSRHGKTSLAAMLSQLGNRLLTEDLCCIEVGDKPVLYPGPASLRVRADMADHLLPIEGMREIGYLDDRLVLAATDPGDGAAVQIAGLVLLKGFGRDVSLERVDAVDALSDLWLLSFHLPIEEDRTRKFNQLVDLVESIPVWELTQPSHPGAIRSTAESLITNVGQ